jgi:mono/diheme cytochrome c family protein
MKLLVATAQAAVLALAIPVAADEVLERGEYLVGIMLCADCHTPPSDAGGPDMARALTGGLGFEMPGIGIFWAPNLTPAKTGLGAWSEEEIVEAIRTGNRPDGRILIPIMPWGFFASLTDEDARAIALYLKSLPAVENAVPAPVGPGQAAPAPYMQMVFPETPKPKG